MIEVKISLAFKKLSAALSAVFGQSILTAITGNSNFLNPFPVITDLQTAVTDLKNAIALFHPGDKASGEAVKAAKRKLNPVLKALAGYVEYISDTKVTIALSSGFSIVPARQGRAKGFTAVQGLQSGSVEVRTLSGANSYVWQYYAEPLSNADWHQAAVTTRAAYTINGLNPGTKYWFRVAAITKNGQQPWGNPVMVHVV